MPSPWSSLYLPLHKGLDLSKEATLGSDELHEALNVEYTVDGQVRGRPSRSAPLDFTVRNPASPTSSSTASTYLTPADFDATGFTPRGLMRVRDANGERPALGCDGRLFTQDDGRWTDRGPFACAKVDRVFNFDTNVSNPADSRTAMTIDFGRTKGLSTTPYWGLLAPSGALERELVGTASSYGYAGNGARCGTVTAVVTRGSTNNLYLHYRNMGGTTITSVLVATDAASVSDTGDAPAVCSSSDANDFWVAYRTTTANVFKVVTVNNAGTVAASYTSGAIAGLHGLWLDNSSRAANRVLVGFTHATGLTLRKLDATTMFDTATDATHNPGGGLTGLDVVVGLQSDTLAWWAYRISNPTADGDIAVGVTTMAGTTATLVRNYKGGASYQGACIRWSIVHQPILVNGRMYLTLAAATNQALTATWITLDLTNWYNTTATTGPFINPTLVARGPTQGTYPHLQPGSAILLPDDDGFVFPTQDWSQFELEAADTITGLVASQGLTRVTFSGPRSVQVGDGTVFSGSIPHFVAGGDCAELGFPFLGGTPGIAVDGGVVGGAVGLGNYAVQACWRWVDEAGQIHRSAPSSIETVAVAAGTIRVCVTNPWLTEKIRDVMIEVYSTDIAPTTDSDHRLQVVTWPVFSEAYTVIDIITQPVTNTDVIYTDGDVYANLHVPADGGVAVVGRRVWVAGADKLFASKLLLPGFGPEFNDEGQLVIDLPAGAGRIVSLENLDNKLVVFCERGVFFVPDGGPDNTAVGADFNTPVRLSDLSIAGPRASCNTDAGVLFCTALNDTDPSRGGPWLLDRQLTLTERQYLGRNVLDYLLGEDDWVPEVSYAPERQQVFITVPRVSTTVTSSEQAAYDTVSSAPGDTFDILVQALVAGTAANGYTLELVDDGTGSGTYVDGTTAVFHFESGVTTAADLVEAMANSAYLTVVGTGVLNRELTATLSNGTDEVSSAEPGVVVFDMRVSKWAAWELPATDWGDLRSIAVVGGWLWVLGDEPAPLDGTPGTDDTGAYTMAIKTSHLASNGHDGAGWGRVRSIFPMSAEGALTHNLTITATQDLVLTSTSGAITCVTPAVGTPGATWPTRRLVPEWRLPMQKCSTLQVQLSASPATARWSAIRLDVQPLPKAAPPRSRS